MSFLSELREQKLWHPNGNLWLHNFLLHGKFEGNCKAWHENGHLGVYEFYRCGLFEGKRTTYYSNGQPRELEYYKNGNLQGERKFWRSNGLLANHDYWVDYMLIRPVSSYYLFFKLKRCLRLGLHDKTLNTFLVPDLVKFGVEN